MLWFWNKHTTAFHPKPWGYQTHIFLGPLKPWNFFRKLLCGQRQLSTSRELSVTFQSEHPPGKQSAGPGPNTRWEGSPPAPEQTPTGRAVRHPDPPSGCTASAATLGVSGSIGSVLVSISTGELLRKESFVLLEKRKFRGEQWETALGTITHRKPLNTSSKPTVETQLVRLQDTRTWVWTAEWSGRWAGWELSCWVSRAESLKMPLAPHAHTTTGSWGWDSSAYTAH